MSDSDLTATRLQLLELGYRIIPTRGKRPLLKGWNSPDYLRELTDNLKRSASQRVRKWPALYPHLMSTGIRLENGTGAVDIDVDHPLADQVMQRVEAIAPEVYAAAPTRFGGGTYKRALLVRIDPSDEPFVRLASHRYHAPGDATHDHCVEIFGGAVASTGNCSRHLGVDGPHSYAVDDLTVLAHYRWDPLVPALWEVAPNQLPVLTRAQAGAIADAFDALAMQAGWERIETVEPSGSGDAVYDITEDTRFDVQNGPDQVSYDELVDLQAVQRDLRVSGSFIDGGSNRSRCWVTWSKRHDCVAVYDYAEAMMHYPAELGVDEMLLADQLKQAAAVAGVPTPIVEPAWREKYKNLRPKASLHNTRLGIEALKIHCSWDVFHNRMQMGRSDATSPAEPLLPFFGEVTDTSLRALRMWFSNSFGFDPTEKYVRDTVVTMCEEHAFNPVVEMLAEAEANWDGVARLDRMAVDCFNTADTAVNRQCVRKVMIAAVARARQPGCKFDFILTMEAPEGWNKSSSWRVLAGDDNFSDANILGKDSREVQEQLAGVWIHENAELAGLRKADVDRVKAFASQQEDRARPAYGHLLVKQPRHSVEVGTINSYKYLQSMDGNRRFWPIRITAPIDLAKLRAVRLQLWGEAAHYQRQGESLVLPSELWPLLGEAQEERRITHPWEEILADLTVVTTSGPLGGLGHLGQGIVQQVQGEQRVATAMIFAHVLNIPHGQMDNRHSKTLADIMRRLGWAPKVFLVNDKTTRGYARTVKHTNYP